MKSRRLRVETAIIAALARRLTHKLRRGDPLATRVKLTKLDVLAAAFWPGLRYARMSPVTMPPTSPRW